MKPFKWLVTGATGFIGQQLVSFLVKRNPVTGIYFKNPPVNQDGILFRQLDVLDREKVLNIVEEVKPDCVVHLAGAKDVDWCEQHSDETFRLNCESTRNLAEACLASKAFLVFLSSDHVFDGAHGDYRASSPCIPATVYGQTKLQAEKVLTGLSVPAAIIRTGGVYSAENPDQSFLGAACVNLRKHKPVIAYTNVYNTPTFMGDLIKAIEIIGLEGLSGIFHLAGPEKESRYSFLRLFSEAFHFPSELIAAKEYKMSEDILKRPLNVSLHSQPFYRLLNLEFLNAGKGLEKAMSRNPVQNS